MRSKHKQTAREPIPAGPGRPPTDPLALSRSDAAKLLSISARKLWSMTVGGEVPYARIGRRVVYPKAALERWLCERTKGAQQ